MLAPSILLPAVFALTVAVNGCAPKSGPRPYYFSGMFWHFDHELTKRWYSVPEIEDPIDISYMYPWPHTCQEPPHQPVRVCFKDARSAKTLKEVFEGSVAMWAGATSAAGTSTMSIEYDAGCPKDKDGDFKDECLCSDLNVAKDALMISDETRDNDPAWNDGEECQTATTVGYSYIPAGEPDRPFRHYMKFCSYDPEDNNRQLPKAMRNMAHELGHAIGLQHEHQRPDRDNFLKFRCRNLEGYHEARDVVMDDPWGMFEPTDDGDTTLHDLDKRARMDLVCSSWTFARKYFPIVHDFLRGDEFDLNADGHLHHTINAAYISSTTFDYDSIMIYDSHLGSRQPQDEHYNVLKKRSDNGNVRMGGGNRDGTEAKISEGDVARVAQLYPCAGEECERARVGTKEWGERGMRVRVRGREAVCVPRPRRVRRDEL